MKAIKKLSVTLFLLLFAGIAMAQDVIVKTDQTTVMSKVIEITSAEIKYKKWNNQDGPTYSISRSEVTSINYQNGEVENFTNSTNNQQNNTTPQVQYLNGYMDVSNGHLKLNDRKLSDNEVKNLVDAESYQLYQKAMSQDKTSTVFCAIGIAGLVTASLTKLFIIGETNVKSSTYSTYYISLAVGLAAVVPGICIEISKVNKLSKIAKTYNQKHGNAYSLNISPSLLRCDTPQSQGNYGLGLTLNVNF